MRYIGTYIGTVVSNADPFSLGRLQVRVVQVYGPVEGPYGGIADTDLPWALPAGVAAGGTAQSGGWSWLPVAGDQVFVRFLDGEPEKPIWEFANQNPAQYQQIPINTYDSHSNPTPRGAVTRYSHLLEFTPTQALMATKNGYGITLVNGTSSNSAGGAFSGASGSAISPGSIPPAGGQNLGMSVFGLVPNGQGGYKNDPQDNGIGAWGANTQNPNLVGFALSESQLEAAGIPQNQWKNTFVSVYNPSTGTTVTGPVVDLLGTPGRVDATYGAYTALGGSQENNGSVSGVIATIIPPGGTTANANASGMGNLQSAVNGDTSQPGVSSGISSGNAISNQNGQAGSSLGSGNNGWISAATPGGNRFEIYDSDDLAQLYCNKSFRTYVPEHLHKVSTFTIQANQANGQQNNTGGVQQTAFGNIGTIVPTSTVQQQQQGGRIVFTAANLIKYWSQDTFEMIAKSNMGVASENYRADINTAAAWNIASTLIIQGKQSDYGTDSVTAAANAVPLGSNTSTSDTVPSATASSGSYLETLKMIVTNTTMQFQTMWKVDGSGTCDTEFDLKSLVVQAQGGQIAFTTDNQFSATAQQDIQLSTQQNFSVTATESIAMTATQSATLTATEALSATGLTVDIEGETTLTASAGTVATFSAAGMTLTISAAGFDFT